MRIFAIADTHLSGRPPAKPMSVFGDNWINHWDKIKTDWLAKVTPDDAVLLAGDISWAMKLEQAMEDLNEIIALPGKKILVRGNHDYWWQTVGKMNAAVSNSLTFLHNNYTAVGNYAICGSRGWLCPDDPFFKPETDLPIYTREISRVKTSLAAAKAAGYEKLILLLHYPPLYERPSGFTRLLDEYGAAYCVYGHLHNEAIKTAATGLINQTRYILVSCDALNFQLRQIV